MDFFLELVGEKANEEFLYDVADYDQLNKKDEIDFMLKYKNKSTKKSISIGLEIKKPNGTLGQEQVEKYLDGMKIKKKNAWRLKKKSSRAGKYLVILTSDLSSPKPVRDAQKYTGFDRVLFWVSWYKIIDWMNNQASNRTFKQLIAELEKEGIRPSNSSIKVPTPYKTMKKRIVEIHKIYENYKDTRSAIDNQLKNLEFQMKNLGYSSMKIPKRLSTWFDAMNNIPLWHGKLFTKQSKSSGSGIAFGYCHTREQWFVHVESNSTSKEAQKIIRALARKVESTNNRKWVGSYKRNNNTDGGWKIDTTARTPAKLAKFMDKVWTEFQNPN